MSNKILITGGNGKTSRRIAERLAKRNIPFLSVSRSTFPAFDWYDETTWADAFKGILKAYIAFQPDLAIPASVKIIKSFVEAAKENGVQHLVLLSGRGEEEAQVCENIVMNSGLQWTIVRASWFMQNFSEGFFVDSIAAGEIVLPVIPSKEPFIHAGDIADIVVEALTGNAHYQKLYEVTGAELLTFQEAVAAISAITGTAIVYQEVTMAEYTGMLRSYQLPEDYIWLIQYLFTEVMDGRNESITHDVEKVLKRKPLSFKAYVDEALKSGVWNREV